MGEPAGSYQIRLARPEEVPRLREIEDEAGTIFSGLGLIDEALDVSFPLDDLARLLGMGQVEHGCSCAASSAGSGPRSIDRCDGGE